jgi:hypothetical protein
LFYGFHKQWPEKYSTSAHSIGVSCLIIVYTQAVEGSKASSVALGRYLPLVAYGKQNKIYIASDTRNERFPIGKLLLLQYNVAYNMLHLEKFPFLVACKRTLHGAWAKAIIIMCDQGESKFVVVVVVVVVVIFIGDLLLICCHR